MSTFAKQGISTADSPASSSIGNFSPIEKDNLQKDLQLLHKATKDNQFVDAADGTETIKAMQRVLNAAHQPRNGEKNWDFPRLPETGKIGDWTESSLMVYQNSRDYVPNTTVCDRPTVEGLSRDLGIALSQNKEAPGGSLMDAITQGAELPKAAPIKERPIEVKKPIAVEPLAKDVKLKEAPAKEVKEAKSEPPKKASEEKVEAKLEKVKLHIPINVICKAFPGSQANVAKYYPIICEELAKKGITNPRVVAAAIANLRSETCTFKPITERASRLSDRDGQKPYDYSKYNSRLGNRPKTNDAQTYCGRGFIQLTGRANYEKYGKKIGEDLVKNPEKANDPRIAAKIFAAYISDKKGILETGSEAEIRAAVNGGQNGKEAFKVAYRILKNYLDQQKIKA